MTTVLPPLPGYNNNVQYQGRIFHVQTEDSGVRYARVVTHLYADGGRIVGSSKADYADSVGLAEMTAVVKKLMRDQHRAMINSLWRGEFDEVIERIPGLPPRDSDRAGYLCEPSSSGLLLAANRLPSESLAPAPEPAVVVGAARTRPDSTEGALPSARRATNRPRKPRPNGRTPRPPSVVPGVGARPTPARGVGTLPVASGVGGEVGCAESSPKNAPPVPRRARVVPAPAESRRTGSLFHDGSIEEQSLDEVILSYLRDDLEER